MSYLSNHHLLSSQDLDELRVTLDEMFIPHQINIKQNDSKLNASVNGCTLGNLSLGNNTYGHDVNVEIKLHEDQCHDIIIVNIPVSGNGCFKRNGESWNMSTNKGLVLDMQQPFSIDAFNMEALTLSFSMDILKQHAHSLIGDKIESVDFKFERELDMTSPMGQSFRNSIIHAAQEMNGPIAYLNNPIAIANIENYLLTQFLALQPNSLMDIQQNTVAPSILHRYLKRACDYIHAHAHEKVMLQDLSVYAGCSYRTLQKAFNETFSMSPMAYLTALRLKNFRKDLLDESSAELNVSIIAKKWGFVHMGRLAKQYKDQYGALPSETLRNKK